MINETIQTVQGIGGITFDKAFEVTSSIPFIIALIAVWALPLLIYLIWGSLGSARTPSGKRLQSKAIMTSNFWIGFAIFFFIQGSMVLFLIFPVFLIPFS